MEIRAKVRRLASQLNVAGEMPLSLVVVDYLQLMVGGEARSRAENRQQEIAGSAADSKSSPRPRRPRPRHSAAEPRRRSPPRQASLLSDLRDSGAIEQDADMVMFLYRDEYYNSESDDKGIAEVIVGKHRNGPTGKVQLAWMEQYTKFASLARRV